MGCKTVDFKNKVAISTGAASGMGLLFSEKFAELSGDVIMCDVNEDVLFEKAAEINKRGGGRAVPVVCDVRDYESVCAARDKAVEAFGRIDVMANFAGGTAVRARGVDKTKYPEFPDVPIDVYDWGIDVNLKGAIYFARACMPAMVKGGNGGVICCIGSTSGFECDVKGAMYGTAKSGLFTFVKGLALAGAPYGIRAFCVTPGPVMTRPGMAGMKTLLDTQSEPQELVDYILYLCSENGRCHGGRRHYRARQEIQLCRNSYLCAGAFRPGQCQGLHEAQAVCERHGTDCPGGCHSNF